MSDTHVNKIEYLVIIADQKKKNTFLSLVSEYGAHAVNTVYAHGSAYQSTLFAAALGFSCDITKVMITCIMQRDKAKSLIDTLINEYDFNSPNTGFAYGISVDGLAF